MPTSREPTCGKAKRLLQCYVATTLVEADAKDFEKEQIERLGVFFSSRVRFLIQPRVPTAPTQRRREHGLEGGRIRLCLSSLLLW